MAHQIWILLESVAIVFFTQEGASHCSFKPNALVVVNWGLITAIFKENGHNFISTFSITCFSLIEGRVSIDSTISSVQKTSFFKHLGSSFNITSFMVDLSLKSVKFEQSWCMLNSLVHKSESLSVVATPHEMIRDEVKEPDHHSWVLFLFISRTQSSFFLHRGEVRQKKFFDLLNFLFICVQISQILHHWWRTFNEQRSYIGVKNFGEILTCEPFHSNTLMSVHTGVFCHVLLHSIFQNLFLSIV